MSSISPLLKIGLQFLGAWPDTPYAIINRVIYMSSILIMQYFQYLYIFAHCKSGELQNLVGSLPSTFDYSLTIIKLVTLWTNHRRPTYSMITPPEYFYSMKATYCSVIREILTLMDTDWRECVSVEQDLHVMTTKASISHFCTNVMMSFYMFVGALYLVGDYVIGVMYLTEDDNDTTRPFPLKLLFPFDAEQSPIYELLVVALFLHAMLNMYTVSVLNSLIFTLVLHASGRIDIICQEFKSLSEKISYYESSGHIIGILVEKHKKIISFSENLDVLFSFMALMQIFWNTLVICSLGLLIIISIHDETGLVLVKNVLAYGGVMLETFIFCSAGEYLTLKSKSLADAAYESLWYKMSANVSKNILFMIMRSQKQLTITAGGMTNLSLEAFTNFMKASASYVSVLNAMY